MSDANEAAWTAEGGKAIPNAVNESSEGTGFQPGDGVVGEASGPQEVSSPNRTPEEEFLAQMLASTGATNLEEAGLYDVRRGVAVSGISGEIEDAPAVQDAQPSSAM